MNRKLRVVIAGGGGILGAHAPGFLALQDICEVVAVSEVSEERHERIRTLLKNPSLKIVKDYNELFEMDGIDAVDIILPHNLHLPATLRAAEKGWNVLVEKVMARNVWECQKMIDATEKKGLILAVSHDRRYAGPWIALKEIVDSGRLGKILFWKMEHNQNVVFPEGSWARDPNGIGGGAIMSCLTHQIDALRWMGGEVAEVNCMTVVEPSRMLGECTGVISAKMKSGALALLSINWYTQSNLDVKNRLWYEFNHVCGTKGEAYYMHGKGTFFKSSVPCGNASEYAVKNAKDIPFSGAESEFIQIDTPATCTGHQKCIGEFVKAARGEGGVILTPGSDSIKTVEVAEAAYLANSLGKNVTLPITPVPWEKKKY